MEGKMASSDLEAFVEPVARRSASDRVEFLFPREKSQALNFLEKICKSKNK